MLVELGEVHAWKTDTERGMSDFSKPGEQLECVGKSEKSSLASAVGQCGMVRCLRLHRLTYVSSGEQWLPVYFAFSILFEFCALANVGLGS